MKVPFLPPDDGEVHTYCLFCHNERISNFTTGGREMFRCHACGRRHERALIFDPAVHWWMDGTGEYWHEVAGVFIYNQHGQFLFFDRTKSPFGLTVPAGHVDINEAPEHAAIREVGEEVGLMVAEVRHISTSDIEGDSCRRGADAHRWHCFAAPMPENAEAFMHDDEGENPVWLSLEQALDGNLTFATRYILTRYQTALRRVAKFG